MEDERKVKKVRIWLVKKCFTDTQKIWCNYDTVGNNCEMTNTDAFSDFLKDLTTLLGYVEK